MLAEIFQMICDQIKDSLDAKAIKTKKIKMILGPDGIKANDTAIRIELLRFGLNTEHKNFLRESPSDKSFYAFTFFILTNTGSYTQSLELTEIICDHFDKKPFLQINIKEHEFEVAISTLDVTIEELNQFWLVQRQPHEPILFYQARISEI